MVHADHLGRPTRMTDATKATVWQATWKPWGEVQTLSGTNSNNLRFPGQYYQIETGLHYNHHRMYDPVTGRYTQPDPLRFVDGPSVYAYAKNSPYMNVDRTGLDCTSLGGQTTCIYPSEDGPSFSVPSTPNFPEDINGFSWWYHKYDISVPIGDANRKCILKALADHATPGKSNGASPGGTDNVARAAGLDNSVKSYTTNDLSTGAELVVNLSKSGGPFADGYVARGINGDYVHTWGEGTAFKQWVPIVPRIGNYLVWQKQMEEIVKNCSCQK
jgi:RHS repeat-associated protein